MTLVKGKPMTNAERRKRYVALHPDRHRELMRSRNSRKRLAMLAILGDACVRCGFTDSRALQVDHVNGLCGEKRLTNISTHYDTVIRSILRKENKYQLLCANCNWIKRVENNETGWQVKKSLL